MKLTLKKHLCLIMLFFFTAFSPLKAQVKTLSNAEYYKIIDEKKVMANKLLQLVKDHKVKAYKTEKLIREVSLNEILQPIYDSVVYQVKDWYYPEDAYAYIDSTVVYGPIKSKLKSYKLILEKPNTYKTLLEERKAKSVALFNSRSIIECYLNIVDLKKNLNKENYKKLIKYDYYNPTNYDLIKYWYSNKFNLYKERQKVNDLVVKNFYFENYIKNKIIKLVLSKKLPSFSNYNIQRVHDGEEIIGGPNIDSNVMQVRDWAYPNDNYAFKDTVFIQWESDEITGYSFILSTKVNNLKSTIYNLKSSGLGIQIRDLRYPDDPYAFIDTTIFDSSYLNLIYMELLYGYDTLSKKKNILLGIKFTNNDTLLFAVNIEDLKTILPKAYIEFLDYRNIKSFNTDSLIFSMVKFYKSNIEKNKFTGYYSDRILHHKIIEFSKNNTPNLRFSNHYSVQNNIDFGVKNFKFDKLRSIKFENGNIEFELLALTRFKRNLNKVQSYKIHCKLSDFLPYLNKDMQILMKEVYSK